jgi:DNA-directed RNA polymerase subunit RPC12/RpoP
MNEAGPTPLQFDRVVPDSPTSLGGDRVAAVCAACGATIDTEYYQINGHVACASCRSRAVASAETPRGIKPLVTAGLFGLGAGIVGAIIYFAVIALLNLEIGIVAILIGYMVGYAVRRGIHGRGGRRFQVLAVALTYAAIAMAYTPIGMKGALENTPVSANVSAAGSSENAASTQAGNEEGNVFFALAAVFALIAILPVLVVFSSLPGSLISGVIIFVGLAQAWRMTGVPQLQIFGPYRVGTEASAVGV